MKIDNCGDPGRGFVSRVNHINQSGKALLIENSNQGFGNPTDKRWNHPCDNTHHAPNCGSSDGACDKEGVPPTMACPGCNNSKLPHNCGRGNPNRTVAGDWCPYHMFRTSSDIGPDFQGIMAHLHSTIPYLDEHQPLSRPGCAFMHYIL
eukprot:COSAG01_NODE_60_length_29981_cov_23.262533_38_plen_149_part_00